MLAGGIALVAVAAGWPQQAATSESVVAPAAIEEPAPAISPPPSAPTSTPAPVAATPLPPAPPPISDVLSSEVAPPVAPAAPPQPDPLRSGTSAPLPRGTTVVWGGCASDGECHPYNFYWAPTHEVVMQAGERPHKVQHEMCHAHQHWSISGGAPLEPSDYDLESWYRTGEGRSFTAAVAGLSWPWSHSDQNAIEDFAWTCGYWYFDSAHLRSVSPERYEWAAANLP